MYIGITGESGFIGTRLRRCITAAAQDMEIVPFCRSCFHDPAAMREFVSRCDAVVHLAGLSRHPDGGEMIRVNTGLSAALIRACRETASPPRILFGSTTHESRDTPYHESKRLSRRDFEAWAAEQPGASYTTVLMPNTFGPDGKPFFNSVIPTFCLFAARGVEPEHIDADAELKLIHISTLCREIVSLLREPAIPGASCRILADEYRVRLGEVWATLQRWRYELLHGCVPGLSGAFEADLWGAFQSFFPVTAAG